ncbi:MAG: NAD(P)/FAD-dependent oxidoreductase [Chitinophagales bacterium]
MSDKIYDVIVIGAGSGGLSVALFLSKANFKVLIIAKTDQDIGGDCLNDGCIPSKALLHIATITHCAKLADEFGLKVTGKVNIKKAIEYVYDRQEIIREHENAEWLRKKGLDVALGEAHFTGKNTIEVNDKVYKGNKIVIATGSQPVKLKVPGVELVKYYDNKNIFQIDELPGRLLVIGGGPIGIEIAQAFSRLGSKVTVIHRGTDILEHDDDTLTNILLAQLEKEGIDFLLETETEKFTSANNALLKSKNGKTSEISFDVVFVGIGRNLELDILQLDKAGIKLKNDEIAVDDYLRTTNKNVLLCGDIAGSLQFSHAAEFHARIILNNFFSPFKKKLNNDHMSWVTFTEPELATFGLSEKQLKKRKIEFVKLQQDFSGDDRAITDNYQYAKTILYLSKKTLFKKEMILGGTMVAPKSGELIQELILANIAGLSTSVIFNKIYPYPVASRVNQHLVVKHKEKEITRGIKQVLKFAFKLFS